MHWNNNKLKGIYRQAAIIAVCLSGITACDKKINLEFGDRRNVPAQFVLQQVLSENKDTVRQFKYDASGRIQQLKVFGNDVFRFHYTGNATVPDSINDIKCTWQQQQLQTAESKMVSVRVQYNADTITIYQLRKRLIPALPAFKDTLIMWKNSAGNITRSELYPAAASREFRLDNNPHPYVNNSKDILPVLLQYPLAEIWEEIVSLYSGHNVIRYTQAPISAAGNTQEAFRTVDFSYRFDQPLFDVPTVQQMHGGSNGKRYYEYFNSTKQ